MFPFNKKNPERKSSCSSPEDNKKKHTKSRSKKKGLLRLLKDDEVQSASFKDPFLIAEEKHGYRSSYFSAADDTFSNLSNDASGGSNKRRSDAPLVGMVIVVDSSQEEP